MNDIRQLVNRIFSDTIISNDTIEAKEKVRLALEDEYKKLQKSHNDIESMGLLMSKYHDLDSACNLIGHSN